jgi:hypothetical protein
MAHQLVAQPRKRKARLSFIKRPTDAEKAAHQCWRFATTDLDVAARFAGIFFWSVFFVAFSISN